MKEEIKELKENKEFLQSELVSANKTIEDLQNKLQRKENQLRDIEIRLNAYRSMFKGLVEYEF